LHLCEEVSLIIPHFFAEISRFNPRFTFADMCRHSLQRRGPSLDSEFDCPPASLPDCINALIQTIEHLHAALEDATSKCAAFLVTGSRAISRIVAEYAPAPGRGFLMMR